MDCLDTIADFTDYFSNGNCAAKETLALNFLPIIRTDGSDSAFGIGWQIGFERKIENANRNKNRRFY